VSSPPERLAAIDVGSNTILFTVAEYDRESGLIVIEEGEDQPRLGADLAATGRLGKGAIHMALRALTRIRDTCHRLDARRIAAVATAAVRESANGTEFVQRVRDLGIPLRVISPETEAALTFRSATYRFPGNEHMLVADIGGGSLELVGAVSGTVKFCRSLPLGAVRLTELGTSTKELGAHIREVLSGALSGTQWGGSRIIGSGGTFATLASMALAHRGRSRQHVHGTEVGEIEVNRLLASLDAMPLERRRETPGLRPERADIIVAGLAVVAELLRETGSEAVTISSFGLRDGLLLEMAGVV
jgi:exopolyphosphatase / guanosine-5'-triphosphate,3'-diphosphate pyrophosphatase